MDGRVSNERERVRSQGKQKVKKTQYQGPGPQW